MRIRLIKSSTVRAEVLNHGWEQRGFDYWLSQLKSADWQIPADILKSYPGADILGRGSNRVIFNIGGNKYRMICQYYFGERLVQLYVCWIGDHRSYDKLCNQNRQYDINKY